ncbi:pilus assembly protein PilB [Nostoc sp. TCL26-01]|uniref:GspE/PulE/PilB domain-containing protein n=1 Tax=Nostoc sp. TCL26-01 TaxID=2576904 RepID=UPI0015B9EF08|nr:pilus assembly protein PilB [Nostoc sp. TCL26-01]QLE55752.1 pilus assembly protein PilB [Nostoc sp. TCL26-01]
MWSSEGKPADPGASQKQLLNTTLNDWEQEAGREQIFQLIDSILSFEACLYYQVLPLKLGNNQLSLGMVQPQDSTALDYVSQIVSYLNCTMVTVAIAIDTHRTILSAYLNYKNTFSPETKPVAEVVPEPSPEDIIATPSLEPPANLSSEQSVDLFVPTNAESFTSTPSHVSALPENKAAEIVQFSDVTVLQIHTSELFSSIEALVNLPPRKFLEELLARVLGGGIGRLYLERQPYQGRIIWSDNGVLQSVLENLPLSVFQGVLNELKRFAAFPVNTVAEAQQIEKECLYQNSRLLLRIRVMPGIHGEEATLQVLRGAALKFYQQQQLARLSGDIIGISQQLSYKLHELHQRLLLNPSLKSEQADALTTLNRLVEKLDQQIKILTANNQLPTDSKSSGSQ